MKDSVHKKRVDPKRLADGAPNVLIILIDDVGPGTPSTYGGEVNTPALDRVAKAGISYNRFHSTAMCSATRASLLTGRNHTRVGNGQICELANDCLDLGSDLGSPVSLDYFDQAPFKFNGKIEQVHVRYTL